MSTMVWPSWSVTRMSSYAMSSGRHTTKPPLYGWTSMVFGPLLVNVIVSRSPGAICRLLPSGSKIAEVSAQLLVAAGLTDSGLTHRVFSSQRSAIASSTVDGGDDGGMDGVVRPSRAAAAA